MAFSLSNWFKGKPPTPDTEPEVQPSPGRPPVSAPPSVRTAVPNSPHPSAAASPRPPVMLTANRVPTSGKVSPVLPSSRRVSFAPGTAKTAEPAPPPPERVPAFVPTVPDVTVRLEVGDFLDRLPSAFLQPGSFDRQKTVEFAASELYSDLAKGRASVPASTIYNRCPEIFSRPVTATEDVEIQLPLQKLVEQMGTALSTRTDQIAEENVGEVETPFLQVALEDNERVPTAAGSASGAIRPPVVPNSPIPEEPASRDELPEAAVDLLPLRPHRTGQISAISPVKTPPDPSAPATSSPASPIIAGKRPPSTVRASVAGGKIRLSGPAVPSRISPAHPEAEKAAPSTHSQRITLPLQATPSPSHQVTKKTARIQIPPISLRTGGPNSALRPASVPPTSPVPPSSNGDGPPSFRSSTSQEGAPTISFRTSPPPPSIKPVPPSFAPPRVPAFPPPSFPAAAPAATAPSPAAATASDDRKIELGLSVILRGLPATMLTVDPSTVPDAVRIALPFALIEPQLSLGRVTVRREAFIQALPEDHCQVLSDETEPAEILLPLQEVFQNLPFSALTIRHDQVTQETGTYYPTPFSLKADEDAQRFGTTAASGMSGHDAAPAPEANATDLAPRAEPTPDAETKDQVEADTVTDLSTAAFQLPGSSVDSNAATIPARDVPLDLETSEDIVQDSPPQPSDPPTISRDLSLGDVSSEPELSEDDTPSAVEPADLEIAAKQAPEPSVEEIPAAITPTPAKLASAVPELRPQLDDGVLQTLFMTEDALDAKTIVKWVCQLPGIDGCAVVFEDGLRLAGNYPEGNTEGFSAMAAPFYKRAARFVTELELGDLQACTLHTKNGLLSFFMHDSICVSVHHAGRGFLPGVREKIETVTHELARMYTTAKPDAE